MSARYVLRRHMREEHKLCAEGVNQLLREEDGEADVGGGLQEATGAVGYGGDDTL